ncbi:MAG: TonB-dependent receptor [Bacteroidetes bacterium]|nr:TonB-dependent receptor [Bacteroidota bacterium]
MHYSKKYFFGIFLFLLLIASRGFSQTISGFIFEKQDENSKSPLPGVTVQWVKTTKGTVSDNAGKFQLSMQGIRDRRIVVRFLGYRQDTLMVTANVAHLDIEMHPVKTELQTVEIKEKQDNSLISKLNARQTQVINIGELQRAACCNLAESFETNASVDVSYSDAVTGAKQIQLLGLSGIYSQIMTENIPLIRGLASSYGLNYIPGPWMESIQISKGTASVVNGYESTTGQINVEYKKPENSDKFYMNLYMNSNLRVEENFNGSIKLNDKFSTMLMIHGDQFANKFDRNSDGFMDLPKLMTYNIFNRWDYINPGKMVSKLGIKYLDETRTGGQMDFDKETMNFDTTGITNDTKKYGFDIHTKRLEGFWKNGFFLQNHPQASIGLILSGVNHEQTGYYGLNKYYGHERSLYANLIFNTSMKNNTHKIAAGLSYLLDDFVENFDQDSLTYLYQVNGGSTDRDLFTLVGSKYVQFDMNRTEWVPGAFFEYTLKLKDKFTMIVGLRGDYDNLWGFFAMPRLHLRYKFNETTFLRGSIGMGYRTANVLAENSAFFISQRSLVFSEKLKQEEAVNFGLNFTKEFKLFHHKATFDIDAYRTSFFNQVVVDADSLPTAVFFSNLHGQSYANSIQAQFILEPATRFTITAAFRVNDVHVTEGGVLREKAFVNLYKGLLTLSYATKFEKWKFDLTGQLNGPARIPDSEKMPAKLQRPGHSPVWFQLLGQITKKFKIFDIYLGGENLTNFTQDNRIVEYWKPFHTHFDASMVWGPVTGITIYGGIRLTIK